MKYTSIVAIGLWLCVTACAGQREAPAPQPQNEQQLTGVALADARRQEARVLQSQQQFAAARQVEPARDRDGDMQSSGDPTREAPPLRGYILNCPQPSDSRFNGGRLGPRECTLTNLRLAGDSRNYDWVVHSATTLNGFYERRADRQQRFMDIGATITATGAAGAGFAGRVGVATQRAWLGLAFVPVLYTQQNANEPTRDLYYAGSIALQLISARYATLFERTSELAEMNRTIGKIRMDCTEPAATVEGIGTWPQGDDRAALLPEAQRILNTCRDLEEASREYELAAAAAIVLQRNWTSAYANDVLELDALLLDKDRRFRYSPSETIGLMIAAPLRSLDTLVSGQNPDAALKRLQAAEAFEGMTQDLSPTLLPTQPRVIGAVDVVNANALARGNVTQRPQTEDGNDATPDLATVRSVLARMNDHVREAQFAASARSYEAAIVANLYAASSMTQLRFRHSASTGVVTVGLGAPGATPPPPPNEPVTEEGEEEEAPAEN